MFAIISKIKDVIFDILFPAICINCRKILNKEQYLCKNCHSAIKLNTSLFCPICKKRLAENKKQCACHIKNKTQKFSYLLAAAGSYDDPALQNLIHFLKYQKFENLAPVLGEIVLKYLSNLSLSIVKSQKSIVVPIPLHFWRERTRGFNQSKLLAESVAKNLNLQMIDGLKRIKNNQPQAKAKNSAERNKNVEGIFKIKNPNLIRGRNILLVDDVFTSGATMNEAVKILKQNNAKRIIAVAIAKA